MSTEDGKEGVRLPSRDKLLQLAFGLGRYEDEQVLCVVREYAEGSTLGDLAADGKTVYLVGENPGAGVTVRKAASEPPIALLEPHVFSDGESGYGIFLNSGDVSGYTFEVKEGETILTHKITPIENESKTHLEKNSAESWITDPGSVRLTVTKDGVSVVYEPVKYSAT